MPDRCRDDNEKKKKAELAKALEMMQKKHEEEMAEEERLDQLATKKREEQKAKMLERGELISFVFSLGPRITWRVDDSETQGFSGSTESSEREKPGTNEISEYLSVILEAVNHLEGRGAHPEIKWGLLERIQEISEPSLELDTTSDEHFQLLLIAKRTLLFLYSRLLQRTLDWRKYKRIHGDIKRLLEEIRQVLATFPTEEKSENCNIIRGVKYSFENIKRNLRLFENLEELFSGDENEVFGFYDDNDYHKQTRAFEKELWEIEQEFRNLKGDLCQETDQVEQFKDSAAEIKIKVDHVEELIGLLNRNQSTSLPNHIEDALKLLEVEIEEVEKKMRECELDNKFMSVNLTRIEGLHSKLKDLKGKFSEASEHQLQFPENANPNQEKAVLEIFSQLTPEDARNLLGKLQDSYGTTVAKPEEQEEDIPNACDMAAEELGKKDCIQEPVAVDEPIDPNDLSVEENFQRLLAEQTRRNKEELEAKRRERAEKNRAEQEEIRAWTARLQNLQSHAGGKNN